MAQQRKDVVESCEENQEEEDTIGMQEDITGMQGGDPIEGQGSGEEIAVDEDFQVGSKFSFDRVV